MAVLSKFAHAFDDYASPIEVNVIIQNQDENEYEDDLLSIDSLEEKVLDVIPKVEKTESLDSLENLVEKKKSGISIGKKLSAISIGKKKSNVSVGKKKSEVSVEQKESYIVKNEMVLNGVQGIETPLDVYRCELLEHILGSGPEPMYKRPTTIDNPRRSFFGRLKKRISKAFRFR